MNIDFKFEHVGYITDSIKQTSALFRLLGYEAGNVVDDDTQRTRICFLSKAGSPTIELVEPYEDNKTMVKMLKKGVAPYHTCYEVENVRKAYDQLLDAGFTPLFEPVAAPAFNGRLICYFWNGSLGLIEIVGQ